MRERWPKLYKIWRQKPPDGEERNLNYHATYAGNESDCYHPTLDYLRGLTKDRLRCDRSNPCHNCSRRGLAGSCNFPESTTSLPATSSTGSPSQPAAPNVKDRVKQLETQVDLLMGALRQTEGSQTTSPQRGPDAIQPRVEAAYSPSASYEEPVLVAQDTAGYMEFSPTGTTYGESSLILCCASEGGVSGVSFPSRTDR